MNLRFSLGSVLERSPCASDPMYEIKILINVLWGFSKISISPFDVTEPPEWRRRQWRKSARMAFGGGKVVYRREWSHFITLWLLTPEKVHPSSTFFPLPSSAFEQSFLLSFQAKSSARRRSNGAHLAKFFILQNNMLAWIQIISK